MRAIKNVPLFEIAKFTEECVVPVSEGRSVGDVGDCYVIVVSGFVDELGVIQSGYELGLMVLSIDEAKWLDEWVAAYSYFGMVVSGISKIFGFRDNDFLFEKGDDLHFLSDKSVDYVLGAWIYGEIKGFCKIGSTVLNYSRECICIMSDLIKAGKL